jgi:MerR family transcriptional regulator, aldehyde-responsive regulator
MGYSIKDVSAMTGLSAYTIRYYGDALIMVVGRDDRGNRVFEEADVEWLRYVTCLRLTGMSIAQMRRIAELTRQGDSTIPERLKLLEAHRKELRKRMDSLVAASDRLEHKIAYYVSMQEKLAASSSRKVSKEATIA